MGIASRYTRRSFFTLAASGIAVWSAGCGGTAKPAARSTELYPGHTPDASGSSGIFGTPRPQAIVDAAAAGPEVLSPTPVLRPTPVLGATPALSPTPTASATPAVLAASDGKIRSLFPPTDPAWSYYAGPWMKPTGRNWPDDAMTAISSPGRGGAGLGRRYSVATDSPSAALVLRATGQSLRVSVNGAVQVLGPFSEDGWQEVPVIYSGHFGVTTIDVWTSDPGENHGILIEQGFRLMRPTPDPAKRKKLLGFGHGYVEGAFASHAGWTSVLPLVADALGWQPINQGIGGTEVDADAGGGERTSGLDRLQPDVIELQPDAILVIFGLNVVKPAPEFQADCLLLLQRLRADLPDTPVFWSGIPALPALTDEVLQPFNDAIRAACEAVANCTFMPAAGWWNPDNFAMYVSSDEYHPTDQGYKFLADKYLAVMKPVLAGG